MATTTPNFGWPVPTSTDLVKDGATAIEALGDGIDTSMVDLKGGTTGQILAKATSADMDFAWITNDVGDITEVTAGTGITGGGTSGAVTITNSMATAIDAKGDLVVGTGADTFAKLSAAANGSILTTDSGETTGLKYTGTWVTFTPTSINGFTLGNGTAEGRYCRVGKVTYVAFKFVLGSTSAVTGEIYFNIPAAAGTCNFSNFNGVISYVDAGTNQIGGSIETTVGGSTLYTRVTNSNATFIGLTTNTNSTTPFTWTTGDSIIGYTWFEVQ